MRNAIIILIAILVIALPFIFRVHGPALDWKPGDPALVIVSPHNEAIRFEFDQGFSRWHQQKFGSPVKIEWRSIGGTTEISRYLTGEFTAAFRAWCLREKREWPMGATESVTSHRFTPSSFKGGEEAGQKIEELRVLFRATDDAALFTSGVDLFFGGGEYDHNRAQRQGLSIAPWAADAMPEGLLRSGDIELIPERNSGEVWRSTHFFGNALSTFGICYNMDRLQDLGVESPPSHWRDLTDPRYFKQVGVADPTKSGSIAKAFEMIIHQQCHEAVAAAGFSEEDCDRYEKLFATFKGDVDQLPEGVPAAYQEAIERGWLEGIELVRRIGANARYFTDSSSKVPVDVGAGDAAVGLAIDFYGRFQAESSRAPDGSERMRYVTPAGGSSVSCDPVSMMRGAPNAEIARRFIEFLLSVEGQKLWNYRVGEPGGPQKFALRRLPIRRDFYPTEQQPSTPHAAHTSDDLASPDVNPYAIATTFTYRGRWTGRHFGFHRDLIRAMCLDSSEELRAAWSLILRGGGPEKMPAAMRELSAWPPGVSWKGALTGEGQGRDHLETMRMRTAFFRERYLAASAIAQREGN